MPLSSESLQELSAMDDSDRFCSAVGELWELDQFELVQFILTKENWTLMKTSCVHPLSELRRIAILGFGKLFIKSWTILHDQFEVEYVSRQSSLSESRRFKEDLVDFGVELSVLLASQLLDIVVGVDSQQQPLSLSLECFDACCEVIHDLVSSTDSNQCAIQRWCLAFDGSLENLFRTSHGKVCWHPLTSAVVSLLMSNFSQLVSNHSRWPESQYGIRLISSLLVFVLREVAGVEAQSLHSISFDALRSSSKSWLAAGDETDSSRCNRLPLDIVRFTEEWILNHLSGSWDVEWASSSKFCLDGCWEALALTQVSSLAHLRTQVSTYLL